MDDHWRSIVEIKSTMEEAHLAVTKQTDRLTAQLDGHRATTDQTTKALRVDLNDLRGRIIPSLREQSTSIATSVQLLSDN